MSDRTSFSEESKVDRRNALVVPPDEREVVRPTTSNPLTLTMSDMADQRDIVRALHDVIGLSDAEIAEASGVASVVTVRKWRSRAAKAEPRNREQIDDLRAIVGLLLNSGYVYPEEVGRFLRSRNADLNYRRPLSVLARGGFERTRVAAELLLERLAGLDRTAAAATTPATAALPLPTGMVRVAPSQSGQGDPTIPHPGTTGRTERDEDLPLPEGVVRAAAPALSETEGLERPNLLDYLDRLICKPWGSELRVYEDGLTDVWCLHIKSGRRTSLYCHQRTSKTLLCLDGTGLLTTDDDKEYALDPGVVLHIEPGTYHRTIASPTTSLRLVEVQNPRDKFDLVRIGDGGASNYEVEDDRSAQRQVDPLKEVPNGPPMARLRPRSSTKPYCFGLERGTDLRADVDGVMFAISLGEIMVTGPEALNSLSPNDTYLTIRTTSSAARERHTRSRCDAIRLPGASNDSAHKPRVLQTSADHEQATRGDPEDPRPAESPLGR